MAIINQFENIETAKAEMKADAYILRGLMRNPDYLPYLNEQLEHPFVQIELTSKCNFSCYYCNSKNSVRPKGFMEEKLFYHIADQLESISVHGVALHVDGEPTLHPKFYDFVSYLNKKNIPIGLASNSSLLQDKFLELEYNLITYLSTSAEELKQRSGIEFDNYNKRLSNYLHKWKTTPVKQNISLHVYHEANVDLAGPAIKEKLNFVRQLLTQSGFANVEFRENACCFYSFRKGSGSLLSISFAPIVSGGLFPGSDAFTKTNQAHISPEHGFCDSGWQRMTIFWDGSIGLCCHGLQGESIYTSPDEIWKKSLPWLWLEHPHVKLFRQGMANGRLILNGCKKCLSRYPNKEFYIQGSQFIPNSSVILNEYQVIDPTCQANTFAISGFVANMVNGIVWTVGRRTQFGFKIADQQPSAYTLEIEGIGFAPKELGPDQQMSIVVNGHKVGSFKLIHNQLHTYSFNFSTSKLTDGVIVTLEFSERKSAHELGIGPDMRRLGIGVSRFRVLAGGPFRDLNLESLEDMEREPLVLL